MSNESKIIRKDKQQFIEYATSEIVHVMIEMGLDTLGFIRHNGNEPFSLLEEYNGHLNISRYWINRISCFVPYCQHDENVLYSGEDGTMSSLLDDYMCQNFIIDIADIKGNRYSILKYNQEKAISIKEYLIGEMEKNPYSYTEYSFSNTFEYHAICIKLHGMQSQYESHYEKMIGTQVRGAFRRIS